MSWDRTERTLQQLNDALSRVDTPEQCQAAGSLARDALISLAQAVFRPEVHWRSSDPVPSATDSKRQLESYVVVAFAGGGNEEARSLVRSAVQLADALTHKRTATPKDARLAAIACESVMRLLAETEGYHLSGSCGLAGPCCWSSLLRVGRATAARLGRSSANTRAARRNRGHQGRRAQGQFWSKGAPSRSSGARRPSGIRNGPQELEAGAPSRRRWAPGASDCAARLGRSRLTSA